MANTFTDNYNFVKSEIGGDNASWGANLHTTLNLADTALSKTVEDQLISGITNAAINITAGSGTGIISTAGNEKYFESIVVGDKVRISTNSATNAANGTPTVPVIYTVSAKTSADSITVSTQMVTDTSGSTVVTIAKVLEPVHINSGPIVCAPLQNLSAATRTAGGTAVPGSDTTDALVANGDVNLAADVILGASASNTIEAKGVIKSNLVPDADNSKDLGTSNNQWRNAYVTGTANIDGLVADVTYALSGSGTIANIQVVNGYAQLSVTGTSGDYSNFSFGSNGAGRRTVSSNAPVDSGAADGDVHYQIA